jgi:predicted methyltransferase
MRRSLAIALAATAFAACSGLAADRATAAERDAASYAGALADPQRPEADKARDADRMPDRLLAFAEIDRGEVVGDFIMGGGYVTRLLAAAVGPEGKVYAFTPVEFIAFRPAYAEEQDTVVADYAHVEPVRSPIAAPAFPEPLDSIVTVMNLHDLFIPQMPEGAAKTAIAALFGALKPGGKLIVVDHSAVEGSGTSAAGPLHRIDRQAAIDALAEAGFVLEAESDLYARPDDPRDANVFSPSIRGKTDQFTLRFVKPE